MLKKIDCSPDTKEYAPYLRIKKVNGHLYLYEAIDTYNTVTKRKKQTSKYIRKVLPHEDIQNITKDPAPLPAQELKLKSVISYGDAYLFHCLIEEIGLETILLKCLSQEDTNLLLILVAYRLLEKRSISHLSSWIETSDIQNLYPYDKPLTSQAISKALSMLGEASDETIPNFLLQWSQTINKEGDSLLFDITSFSSQAHRMEELEYGYAKDHSPYTQLNMGLLVNQEQHLPLYYKVYPGSLKDVSLLSNIVEEASILGVPSIQLILDRGFYSGYNLGKMHSSGYSFIIPLPRSAKKLYHQIHQNLGTLEKPRHLISMKGKPLYAKRGCIEYPCLKNKESDTSKKNTEKGRENNNTFTLYYGLYMDLERKHQEETSFLSGIIQAEEVLQGINWSLIPTKQRREEIWKEAAGKWSHYFTLEETNDSFQLQKNEQSIQETMQFFGIMILLSSTQHEVKTMLQKYRQRDEVEKHFDAGKNELLFQPLRVHKSSTMKSTMFVLFLSLIVQTYLLGKMKQGNVDTKYSMHSVFYELQKLKKAIWKGKVCIINEITKSQRLLIEQLNIVLPKCLGN